MLLPMQVNFLTKLVALKPGKTVREMIKNVMQGKDEGAESSESNEESAAGQKKSGRITGRVRSCYAMISQPSLFMTITLYSFCLPRLVLAALNHCLYVLACFLRLLLR